MDSLNRHEDYGQASLDDTHPLEDPVEQFKIWLKEAEAHTRRLLFRYTKN